VDKTQREKAHLPSTLKKKLSTPEATTKGEREKKRKTMI
jgi:hypothetical protein